MARVEEWEEFSANVQVCKQHRGRLIAVIPRRGVQRPCLLPKGRSLMAVPPCRLSRDLCGGLTIVCSILHEGHISVVAIRKGPAPIYRRRNKIHLVFAPFLPDCTDPSQSVPPSLDCHHEVSALPSQAAVIAAFYSGYLPLSPLF